MAEIWTQEEWERAERRDPTKTYVELEKGNPVDLWMGSVCFIAMPILVTLWAWYRLSELGLKHLIQAWSW